MDNLTTIASELLLELGAKKPIPKLPNLEPSKIPLSNSSFTNELNKAANILELLDSDLGYSHWVKIGMVLHYLSDGGDEGFLLWDIWSSNGQKYPGSDELLDKYRGFNSDPETCVKMGTLIYIAREHGVDIYKALNGGELQWLIPENN